jgi:CheY-like chemotaxis protein
MLAETQEDGLNQLRERRFDVLLLDIMLPLNQSDHKNGFVNLDAGYEILEALRSNIEWETPFDCIVVVFSARGNSEKLEQMEKLIDSNGKLIRKPVLRMINLK